MFDRSLSTAAHDGTVESLEVRPVSGTGHVFRERGRAPPKSIRQRQVKLTCLGDALFVKADEFLIAAFESAERLLGASGATAHRPITVSLTGEATIELYHQRHQGDYFDAGFRFAG